MSAYSEWDMLDVDTGNIYWLRLCGNASKCQDAHLCANTSKTASATLTKLGNHDNCKMMYSTESKTLHFSFTYTNAPPFKDSRVNVTLTCGNHLVSIATMHLLPESQTFPYSAYLILDSLRIMIPDNSQGCIQNLGPEGAK